MDINPALTAVHDRNKHVVAELRRYVTDLSLAATSPDNANYYPVLIGQLQQLYRDLLQAHNTLQLLRLEGIHEVTLRSRTQTLSWPVDLKGAQSMHDAMLEWLDERLGDIADKILEARERMTEEGVAQGGAQGTAEEWHHENIHWLALLLEAVPEL